MGGGNAFLRFSSSVAAGALILNQVARAQNCDGTPPFEPACCAPPAPVKMTSEGTEGCGSCEDPNLRLLTAVSSSNSVGGVIGAFCSSDDASGGTGALCIGPGLTSLKYTNCAREPFPLSQAITLADINSDIITLSGTLNAKDYVSVVSFPCMTDFSSRGVSFDGALLPSLAKIRFANLVTVGEFLIQDLPALISIFAPLLQSTNTSPASTNIRILKNNLLPKIDLPSLSVAGGVLILENENLKIINLPNLILTDRLSVFGNQKKLKKLCASNLESGGDVCIGNQTDQPFLDADLSKLVLRSFGLVSSCYRVSNAPTVCGNGPDGLFSTAGCPSNAC